MKVFQIGLSQSHFRNLSACSINSIIGFHAFKMRRLSWALPEILPICEHQENTLSIVSFLVTEKVRRIQCLSSVNASKSYRKLRVFLYPKTSF